MIVLTKESSAVLESWEYVLVKPRELDLNVMVQECLQISWEVYALE